MMQMRHNRVPVTGIRPWIITTAVLTMMSAVQAHAQVLDPGGGGGSSGSSGPSLPNPPTAIDTQSPGGVNLSSGSFTERVVDLRIGGEGHEGLALVRMYDSSNPGALSTWAGLGGAPGWTHNWAQRVTNSWVPKESDFEPRCQNPPQSLISREACLRAYTFMYHSAVAGDASYKFQNVNFGEYPSNSGANVGTFQPVEDNAVGSTLVFTGGEATGNFTLTDRSGAVFFYRPNQAPTGMALDNVTYPDGTRITLTYDSFRPKRIESSRGYALIFEYANGPNGYPTASAACVVNLAAREVAASSNCPTGVGKVLYNYGMVQITQKRIGKSPVTFSRSVLTSAVDLSNAHTVYSYDDGGHVSCITDPGQAGCRVQINYNECLQSPEYEPGAPDALLAEMHLIEKVLSQVYADGSRFDYSYRDGLYGATMGCPDEFDDGFPKSGTYSFADAAGQTTSLDLSFGRPVRISDPLGRVTEQQRTSIVPAGTTYIGAAGVVSRQMLPEGNQTEFDYNDRGLIVQTREIPKSGSGLPTLVTTITYPASCTSSTRKVCNQPTSVTDAKGNVTSYTYDPAHGGMLTMTGPAVGGVSPMTRYFYVQREAWLRSGAGYAKTGQPIWLKSEERTCRTSTLDPVAGTCSAGAGDLVRTLYDYGPDAGPNNLWLRGTAVVADGQTQRTCYQYDELGRRIAETKPLGTGATCP